MVFYSLETKFVSLGIDQLFLLSAAVGCPQRISRLCKQVNWFFGKIREVMFDSTFGLSSSSLHLCWCLQSKIVRVLNLWQKNAVFKSDIIQPLLDMAAGILPPSVTPVIPSSAAAVNNTTPGQSENT